MLDAEEAGARLRALADEGWRSVAAGRVGGLSRKARPAAEAFLSEPSPLRYRELQVSQLAAAEAMDGLSERQRVRTMSALHPGLGESLARWWVEARSRPYQRGWQRRAFRAPHEPGLTRAARASELAALLDAVGPHADADVNWLAAWGGHICAERKLSPAVVGGVLASAIDARGAQSDTVVQTLIASGNGEHPVGIMGRHVIVGLLAANRPDGWDYIRRMLLAAQLQEGLRQAILEFADEAHPGAFDLMIATVLDHGLLRFAAVVRGAGVWLGVPSDVTRSAAVEGRLRALAAFRADEAARRKAVRGDDPADVYLALCVGASRDVVPTMPELAAPLEHPAPAVRAAAARFAWASDLMSGQRILLGMLDDPDLGVAGLAMASISEQGLRLPGAFAAVGDLARRLPATPRDVEVGFAAYVVTLDRRAVASRLLDALGALPVEALIPWLGELDANRRAGVAILMGKQPNLSKVARAALLGLVGDASPMVRRRAADALATITLTADEAAGVEALLTRSATDLRRAALTMLATQAPAEARASVDRLAASRDTRQQEAAIELARAIGGQTADEHSAGAAPVEDLRVTLVDTDRQTAPRTPSKLLRSPLADDSTRRIVHAIDDLVHLHKDVPVLVSSWQGTQEILLGDVRYFPTPYATRPALTDEAEEGHGLLLAELFRPWWEQRAASLRSRDGADALAALFLAWVSQPMHVAAVRAGGWWHKEVQTIVGPPEIGLRHLAAVEHILLWLTADDASRTTVNRCLDALETALAAVPDSLRSQQLSAPFELSSGYGHHLHHHDWRHHIQHNLWSGQLNGLLRTRPDLFQAEQLARWFGLMRWIERPNPGAAALAVDTTLLTTAHAAGVATDDDVVAAFLDPRSRLFRDLTRHWRSQLEERQPALVALADRVRERVVAVELLRGDLPTPTSAVAHNIGSVSGVDLAMALLRLLGKAPLQRSWGGYSDGKVAVLSHLLRMSFPAPDDTADTLLTAARASKVREQRLIDLAMYAPQWAPIVEAAVGWPGMTSGVLWLHAHTKGDRWTVDRELREAWAAMVAERTPLAADDLVAGGVDVEWFREAYGLLGEQRWLALHKSAKNASGGTGHRRAQIFAEAVLGRVDEATVTERIRTKRHQDSVRALGLLPLPEPSDEHAATVSRRYGLLREFERGSRQFGALRQNSEQAAVRIGIDNLARTAGYPDPQRFIWAVEAAEAGDLADGPVSLTVGDVMVTLSVSDEGVPDLSVRRGERTLASVPAPLRKHEGVVELRARKTALTRQARRVRAGLEAAMVSGDGFSDADLAALDRHPIVAPMLDALLWVDGQGRIGKRSGAALVDSTGAAFAASGPIRLAHPVDLMRQDWIGWQELTFAEGRRQPFKQAFRELYVLTDAERTASPLSRRYEAHQLQPRQAVALFNSRGWVTSRESGDTSRVFHRYGIAARVEFVNGFLTPLEADLPTIGAVYFSRRGEHFAQPLDDVPPIVFSEAMRDLDLVVSVSHAGGVDPEATASTTEMRAALIRETARLLKLDNLTFVGSHVIIDGSLGEYSIHLGSGTVHRRPGGSVCIIPVGSQHRGRLFLPFADDDPKTAEIVAKTLLLARDRQIKDPTILEQLRS